MPLLHLTALSAFSHAGCVNCWYDQRVFRNGQRPTRVLIPRVGLCGPIECYSQTVIPEYRVVRAATRITSVPMRRHSLAECCTD